MNQSRRQTGRGRAHPFNGKPFRLVTGGYPGDPTLIRAGSGGGGGGALPTARTVGLRRWHLWCSRLVWWRVSVLKEGECVRP